MRDLCLCTGFLLPAAETAAISGSTGALNLGNTNVSSAEALEYVQGELTAVSE